MFHVQSRFFPAKTIHLTQMNACHLSVVLVLPKFRHAKCLQHIRPCTLIYVMYDVLYTYLHLNVICKLTNIKHKYTCNLLRLDYILYIHTHITYVLYSEYFFSIHSKIVRILQIKCMYIPYIHMCAIFISCNHVYMYLWLCIYNTYYMFIHVHFFICMYHVQN